MKKTKKIISMITVMLMLSVMFTSTLSINAAPLSALPPLDTEAEQLAITELAHKSGKNNGPSIQGEGFVVKFNKDVRGIGFNLALQYAKIKIDVTCSDSSVVIAPSYTKLIKPSDFSVVTGTIVAKNTQNFLPKDTFWMYSETKLNSTTTDNFGKLYNIMAANSSATYTLNYSVVVADVETGNTPYTLPIGTSTYTNLDSGGGPAQISYTEAVPQVTFIVPPTVTSDATSVPATIENGANFDYKSLFTSSDCSGLTDSHFLFFLSTDGGLTFEQKTTFDSTEVGTWYIQTSNVTNRVGRAAGQMISFEVLKAVDPVTPPPEGSSGKTYTFDSNKIVHTIGNTKDIVLTIANADFTHFTNVMVDDVVLDTQHYTASSGSIITTLKSSWLNTLAPKSYKISVNINDGTTASTVDAILEVKNPSSITISPITDSTGGAFPTSGQSSTTTAVVGGTSSTGAATGSTNPSTGASDFLRTNLLFSVISLLSGAVFVSKKIKK